MDGFLEPSKLQTYRRSKMTDGLNLTGFNDVKPAQTNNVTPEQYASAPNAAFPATDVSNQASAQGPK
jgi:hypothetical protein